MIVKTLGRTLSKIWMINRSLKIPDHFYVESILLILEEKVYIFLGLKNDENQVNSKFCHRKF